MNKFCIFVLIATWLIVKNTTAFFQVKLLISSIHTANASQVMFYWIYTSCNLKWFNYFNTRTKISPVKDNHLLPTTLRLIKKTFLTFRKLKMFYAFKTLDTSLMFGWVSEGGWDRTRGSHNTVAVVTIKVERDFVLCEVKAEAEEKVCKSSRRINTGSQ